MKRAVSYCLMIFVVAVLAQACASSHQTMTFEPGSIDTGKYVRKVDQFVIIADGSLSMADRSHGERKLGISENLLVSLNQTIPSLQYEAGLRTFGRGLCKSKGKTVSIIEFGNYIGSTFGDGVARYQCANGSSPLDLALDATFKSAADHINTDVSIRNLTEGDRAVTVYFALPFPAGDAGETAGHPR